MIVSYILFRSPSLRYSAFVSGLIGKHGRNTIYLCADRVYSLFPNLAGKTRVKLCVTDHPQEGYSNIVVKPLKDEDWIEDPTLADYRATIYAFPKAHAVCLSGLTVPTIMKDLLYSDHSLRTGGKFWFTILPA